MSNEIVKKEEYEMDFRDPAFVKIVKESIASTLNDKEFAVFLKYCQQAQLNPITKQIYPLKTGGRLSTMVSIDGMRLIAQRSHEYGGQDGPYWCGGDGVWKDVWLDSKPPAAAKVGIWRKGYDKATYAVAHWSEYGSTRNVWGKMPALMLAKCAEALAIRKSFPNDLSGLYSREEMDQANIKPDKPDTKVEEVGAAGMDTIMGVGKEAQTKKVEVEAKRIVEKTTESPVETFDEDYAKHEQSLLIIKEHGHTAKAYFKIAERYGMTKEEAIEKAKEYVAATGAPEFVQMSTEQQEDMVKNASVGTFGTT